MPPIPTAATRLQPLRHAGLLRERAYVDGTWSEAGEGTVFAVEDPASGTVMAEVADLGASDARAAVDAAERALPAWRARTAAERGATVRRWADAMHAERDALALLLSSRAGQAARGGARRGRLRAPRS